MIYTVIGATGQTGSVVARTLKLAGHDVRVVVRSEEQSHGMRNMGYEAVVANVDDTAALSRAFTGAVGAYLLNPPAYMDPDLFARAHIVHEALLCAMKTAAVPHAVALSSIGAQHAKDTGNILTTHDFEQQIAVSGLPITILRAPSFMENWAWSLQPVKEKGILPSMLHPLDRCIPMASAVDIGGTAALLLTEGPQPQKIVEMHGPQEYSPQDAAGVLSQLLKKPVRAVATPESDWPAIFRSSGFTEKTVQAFCDMYKGFNSGLIAFEGIGRRVDGKTTLQEAFSRLLEHAAESQSSH